MKNKQLNRLIKTALLSTLAYLLMFFEFPLPIFPSFLKIDISDLPALIGGFALGPWYGVAIELIKNLLHFVTKSSTGGIGELANFIVGSALVLPAAYVYYFKRTKIGAAMGMTLGVIAMAIAGALANYYILIPVYESFMPLSEIIAFTASVIPAVNSLFTLILYAIVPFNLLKGAIVSVLTLLLYKFVSPLLSDKA